jgi:hypothetical protein
VLATSLLISPILYFCLDFWIRTQRAAVASRRATNLATQPPKKILCLVFLAIFLLFVQVAGATGRIVVSDFWDYDGHDTFQLESFRHA